MGALRGHDLNKQSFYGMVGAFSSEGRASERAKEGRGKKISIGPFTNALTLHVKRRPRLKSCIFPPTEEVATP